MSNLEQLIWNYEHRHENTDAEPYLAPVLREMAARMELLRGSLERQAQMTDDERELLLLIATVLIWSKEPPRDDRQKMRELVHRIKTKP